MSGSPVFKVYDNEGSYQAATKRPEEALVLVAFLGEGSTVRFSHRRIVWTEGYDGAAAESYDRAALLVLSRVAAATARRRAKGGAL